MQTKDNKENLTEILSLLWDNVGSSLTEDNTITWVCDEENRYHMHVMYRQTVAQSICTHYSCFENMDQFVAL